MTRILIGYSDTGGGHRAAAQAIAERLEVVARERQGGSTAPLDITMVDPYAMTQRWPFDRLTSAYPFVVNHASWMWRSGFALTNTARCAATLQSLAWPVLRRTFRELGRNGAPDVVVSTHPLLTAPLRRVFPHTPLAVVVTDLVSGHTSWYQKCADLTIVPTEQARARALRCGLPAHSIEVLGVPVSSRYVSQPGERAALCARLGWSATRPTVVVVGGGDGVGPIEDIVMAIDAAGLCCDVAVVAGRNASLAQRLRARVWRGTVHVYGFVDTLGEMLRASQALVTKAGPGTISEGFAAACPLLLYGAIPGQETGNVSLVCDAGAGRWTPSPQLVVNALADWFRNDAGRVRRQNAADASQALARPHAARDIANRVLDGADTIADRLAFSPICSHSVNDRPPCSAFCVCSRSASCALRTPRRPPESSRAAL